MSWRAFLFRNTRGLRFVVDPVRFNTKGAPVYGTKLWLRDNLATLQMLNPYYGVVLRGVDGAKPTLTVFFDHGEERHMSLDGKGPKDIDAFLREAVVTGEYVPRAKWPTLVKPELPTVEY